MIYWRTDTHLLRLRVCGALPPLLYVFETCLIKNRNSFINYPSDTYSDLQRQASLVNYPVWGMQEHITCFSSLDTEAQSQLFVASFCVILSCHGNSLLLQISCQVERPNPWDSQVDRNLSDTAS